MKFIDKMRLGYAIFYLMRNSGSPKKGILRKEYHKVFYWIIDATEMFQKEPDIKSFFSNIIKALTIANNEFYKDNDYQVYHKIRYKSDFMPLKLKEEIRIRC
ncbi:hypothetical protein Ataiwa_08730 [Algoriphagus taiwanensis]|uniref:Uncharacterized protein n=2 Tax=Algoriphagus taiwanensis TaxID=1445656 RepID=A0ABQ6PXB3_9BACT|nr:hypothetical protein Ataiwa_08730 [Algoriphagus taiwanensis]